MNSFLNVSTDTLKDRVSKVVEGLERDLGRPALMSTIGLRVATEFGRPFRELTGGMTLSQFIDANLANVIEIISPDPTRPLVLAARRKGSPQSSSSSNGDVQPPNIREPQPEQAGVRYDRRFWSAFSKPISVNLRRFVRRHPPYTFIDLEQSSSVPIDHIEIPARLIAPAALRPGADRNELVKRNVTEWVSSNSLSTEQFIDRSSTGLVFHSGHSSTYNPVIEFFSHLSADDLKRIAIPADIVITYLEKKK